MATSTPIPVLPPNLFPNINVTDKKELYKKVIEPDPSIPPNHTLYVKNLNDRIKVDVLKKELMDLFSKFGKILQIVAMKSFWRRGQAWIVFENIKSATEAMKELQGYLLYGHTLQINYALEKSDVISKADGTFVERPKGPKKPKKILQREMMLKSLYSQNSPDLANDLNFPDQNANLYSQPYLQPYQVPTFNNTPTSTATTMVKNRILFLENLPENINKSDVTNLFQNMPGFIETRLILSKRVAFADFDNEMNSSYALQGNFTRMTLSLVLQGQLLNGQPIKISFAK